ncbi:lipoprotein [Pusillimonas sp. CC-YST705]|uniref:Lipoprotein n=1 Tax=Mesopusillimonas faecipullorum TaxID=2755040 RepID=A0ABS8CF99_9BURK|nr:lipoprotein [Mesopusillimonas faecipullorum]MCB5364678.1 lipoprotein [Mesopusillimonas faecipullorum]
MLASRPTAHAFSLSRIVAGFVLTAGLAACGYKGPLHMPPPPPDEASVMPPNSMPVEAPAPGTAN